MIGIETIRGHLAAHPEVAAAYVFGSRARGTARPDSDLDLALVYRRGVSDADRKRVAVAVAAAIGAALGVERVDVVDLEAQGCIFAHDVLIEALRVYEGDPAARSDFESTTMARAFDFRPTYELATGGKATALRRWLRERYDLRSSPVEVGSTEAESRGPRSDPTVDVRGVRW